MIRKSSPTADLSLGYTFVVIGVTLKMELVNVMSVAYFTYFVFIVNLNFGTNML